MAEILKGNKNKAKLASSKGPELQQSRMIPVRKQLAVRTLLTGR